MKDQKIGLVGIGKLGTAMLTHWDKEIIAIGVHHPVVTKAKLYLQSFQNSYLLTEDELKVVDILILALPAMAVIPFITNLNLLTDREHTPVIVNMATNLPTSDIRDHFPDLRIYGVKYMGHSRDLLEHGNGLFISESVLPENIGRLFEKLGVVMNDREDCLTEVNKLATNFALRTAINIENEFSKRGLSPAYLKRALTSLAPEVIRSYSEGNLGHFAKEIVKEIQAEMASDREE